MAELSPTRALHEGKCPEALERDSSSSLLLSYHSSYLGHAKETEDSCCFSPPRPSLTQTGMDTHLLSLKLSAFSGAQAEARGLQGGSTAGRQEPLFRWVSPPCASLLPPRQLCHSVGGRGWGGNCCQNLTKPPHSSGGKQVLSQNDKGKAGGPGSREEASKANGCEAKAPASTGPPVASVVAVSTTPQAGSLPRGNQALLCATAYRFVQQ